MAEPKLISSLDKYEMIFADLDVMKKQGLIRTYKNMRGKIPSIHYRLLSKQERDQDKFIIAKIGMTEAEWFPDEYGTKFRIPIMVPNQILYDLKAVFDSMMEDLQVHGYRSPDIELPHGARMPNLMLDDTVDKLSESAINDKSLYLLMAFSSWVDKDPEIRNVLVKHGFTWNNS